MFGTRLPALLGALAIALSLAACGEKDEPELTPFQIEGTWTGELQQAELKPFTVTATIGSLQDTAQNTVSYTGINCNGNWMYIGREGSAYRFREQITGGKGRNCKGEGIVTLNPFDADGLDYDFQGDGIESAGVLARVSG